MFPLIQILTSVKLATSVIMMQRVTTQKGPTIVLATVGMMDQATTVQVCLLYLSLNC